MILSLCPCNGIGIELSDKRVKQTANYPGSNNRESGLKSPATGERILQYQFTDRSSWKPRGVDGQPLLLDENLKPKPAYTSQIEMHSDINQKGLKDESQRLNERICAKLKYIIQCVQAVYEPGFVVKVLLKSCYNDVNSYLVI